ncbi:glutathione S-transferase [Hahella sp. CCB-MM4]|uniref:glutathione S-transferase family protein n=1 Tax=Hahella sp. (strain CCB-MM4) TaxID=1926491 RepID=UPI000B9C090E|nr:glutathione S-transferase [Hahella sp. CCB-MM4]OZG71090.1 glutathione S-transferase [Hahella sp. CCB-MM4]
MASINANTNVRPQQPIKLYQYPLSGHCHRVQLFMSLLEIPYELILVDLSKGEHKLAEYLSMNRFGQVPVINDNGTVLADSNAILVYLAKRYDSGQWLPEEPERAAHTQRWLSMAAGSLAAGPASARRQILFNAPVNVAEAMKTSEVLFSVMDKELSQRRFLTGDEPTIADIAMYTYTAHAPEGNVSLEPYPHVRAWLARVEGLQGFVPMERSRVGLFAD